MILFEDDAIQVIAEVGTSEFALITFGDMLEVADGVRFNARPVTSKNGITAIGIMPKAPHWYPAENMAHCQDAVREVTAKYRHVILYGGSMGGYAAVRFSRLFHADTVIAMCPQWSIVPDQAGANDCRYQQFFTGNNGFAATAEDVAGVIFVLHDPNFAVDAYNARKIARLPGVVSMPVWNVGHHVMPVLAGGHLMLSLLDAATKNDQDRMRELITNARRSHRLHTLEVLGRSFRRAPRASAAVLAQAIDNAPAERGAEFLGLLAQRMIADGDLVRARGFLDRGSELDPSHPMILFGLGEIKVKERRFEEAFSLMEQATAAPGGPALKMRYAAYRDWYKRTPSQGVA